MEQEETNHEDEVFAGDKDWLAHKKSQSETEEYIHTCISQLCRLLSLEQTNTIPDISQFDIYANLEDLYDLKYFSSATSLLPFTVIACYHDDVDTLYYDDASLLGVVELRNRYPATSLQREKVGDKLADLIIKADIDFKEQKKFSQTFHLVSADKAFIRQHWERKPLDLLADYPALQLIIKDSYCIYKLYDDGLDENRVSDFATLTNNLLKILG